jgi:steroid 5-alpha reductase family enzyme
MMTVALGLQGLLLCLVLMTAAWLASLIRRDASLVDRVWGIGFVSLAWFYLESTGAWSGARWPARLLTIMVTLWGLRLSLYLTWRNWAKGEDYRYRAMRAARGKRFWWVSLVTVFWLQALLLWIIAAPLLAAARADLPPARAGVIGFGAGLWLVGFLFESIGDWQLARFKADPRNRGRVMDSGLWRYTRHPNYFGDAMVWWGYFVFAAAHDAWWAVIGPLVMTVLLMKVSGVALLEKTLQETKAEYRDYVRRTSGFFPRAPR